MKERGSLATATYERLKDPILVEHIQAHADRYRRYLYRYAFTTSSCSVRLAITEIGKAHLTWLNPPQVNWRRAG